MSVPSILPHRVLYVAFVAAVLWGYSPAAQAQKKLTYEQIQTLARDAIAKKYVAIDPPNLAPKDGVLAEQFGGASFVIDPEPQDFDLLLEVVLLEQMGVEIIRNHLREADQKTFWKPYLTRVETIIAEQSTVVQNAGLSEDDRFENVMKRREDIHAVYMEGLVALSKRLGVTLERGRPFRPPRTVELVTNPGGARVYVSLVLEASTARMLGRRPKWRAVPDPKRVQLEGRYHYLIQWPDRTKVGQVNIDHDGRYLLE